MPKTRQQKEESVTKLVDKVSKAKSLVFSDYKGLKMSQLVELRKNLRDQAAEFNITKNSLLKLALKQTNSPLLTHHSSLFEGPVATLFSFGDEIAGIKILVKALKDAQIGKVKGGFLDGEALSEQEILKLSTLPTKDELRAKVVGALGSPLYGIVGVLQANLRNLVYALEQIRKQKGGEAT